MYQGAQTGVVCVLPLLIVLRRKLRELQYVLIAAMTLTRIPLHYVIVTAVRPRVSELFTCLCICLHVIRISSGLSWGPTLAFTSNDPVTPKCHYTL